MDFETLGFEGPRELGVGAWYVPAAVDKDYGGHDSGHGNSIGCGLMGAIVRG